MSKNNEIAIENKYGTLVARVGDGPTIEPEINVLIRNKDGKEMVLVRVVEEEGDSGKGIRICVFSNIAASDPSHNFVITKRQLSLPNGCWVAPGQ